MPKDNFLFQSSERGTFSGVDIRASIVVPDTYIPLIGPVIELTNVNTVSWSTHRDKVPVRRLGKAYAQGYVRGTRTIAGSMVFVNFNSAALWELIGRHYQNEDSPVHSVMTDQLLPFDMNFTLVNEDGLTAFMSLFGVEIVDEGMVLGTDEAYLETTMQYVAVDMDLLYPGPRLREIWDSVGTEIITVRRNQRFDTLEELNAVLKEIQDNPGLTLQWANKTIPPYQVSYDEEIEQASAYMKGLTTSAQASKFINMLKAGGFEGVGSLLADKPAIYYDSAGNPHLDLAEYHERRLRGDIQTDVDADPLVQAGFPDNTESGNFLRDRIDSEVHTPDDPPIPKEP